MKRCILFIIIAFGFGMMFPLRAQDAILEEISEIKDVEVTYITKSMLQSMGAARIKVSGLNLSKIAMELTSLQILTVEDKSVSKVRTKLKGVRKIDALELIMKLKEDGELTELYGEKGSNGNYKKLLLIVDEGDELVVVYMKGSIGKNCFDEMTKKAKKPTRVYSQAKIVVDGTKFRLKEDGSYEILPVEANGGNLKADGLEDIDKQLKELDRELENLEKELKPIYEEIARISRKIKDSNASEREKLYIARSKQYEKRAKVYERRSFLYVKRNWLYNQKAKALMKSAGVELKGKNVDFMMLQLSGL